MSFNEIYSSQTQSTTAKSGDQHSISTISQNLAKLQTAILNFKKKLAECKRNRAPPLYEELTKDMQVISGLELSVTKELEYNMKLLHNLPRTAAAPKRIQLSKYEREFDLLKLEFQSCRIAVSNIKDQGIKLSSNDTGHVDNVKTAHPVTTQRMTAQEVAIQSEADKAYEEQSLQEIRRINEDLVLVNEMFRDMAEIIRSQDVPIQEIAKSTELSNERVHEGLRQIEMAADAQPKLCIIS